MHVLTCNIVEYIAEIRLGNWSRLKKRTETWQLNVMYDPRLNPEFCSHPTLRRTIFTCVAHNKKVPGNSNHYSYSNIVDSTSKDWYVLWWGVLIMGEATHVWGRRYMVNLCTFLSVLLWTQKCSKKVVLKKERLEKKKD